MKLGEIYRQVVEKGIQEDARSAEELERNLEKAKKAYEKLEEAEKELFDQEKLTNPYGDTRILYGDTDTEVENIFCGIDMEVGEILLADRLRERGTPVDLILAHHPEGLGFTNLHQVMGMQADLLAVYGVGIGVGDSLIAPRAEEVRRKVLPANHYRAVDAARLLDMAMMCCHTPADNCVSAFVQNFIEAEKPATLGELIKCLQTIPEYADATKKGVGPSLFTGSENNRSGKVYMDMTGGTSGPVDALNQLSQKGVDTIVAMHMPEDHRKRAEELKLGVVIAGHVSSDAIGMNLVLDQFARQGVNILCTSGMIRVDRN